MDLTDPSQSLAGTHELCSSMYRSCIVRSFWESDRTQRWLL